MVPYGTSGVGPSHTMLSRNLPGNASDNRSLRAASSSRVIDHGHAQIEEETAEESHPYESPEVTSCVLHCAKNVPTQARNAVVLHEVDVRPECDQTSRADPFSKSRTDGRLPPVR